MADIQFLKNLSKRLADDGKLIEAGWVSLRLHAIPLDAPAIQLDNMRLAFMAGAQHLFASMMTILDPEEDVTKADLTRMQLIHKELETVAEELERRMAEPGQKSGQ